MNVFRVAFFSQRCSSVICEVFRLDYMFLTSVLLCNQVTNTVLVLVVL